MTHLDRKELAKLVKLKQTESVWLCSARATSMKIGESDDAIQPYIILVMDATEQAARSFDLVVEAKPDATHIAQVLAKAMYAPMNDAPPEFSSMREDLQPIRPQRVLIDDVALVESLKPVFEEVAVEVNYHAELTPIDQFLQMFDQVSQPKDARMPLLQIAGVQAPMLAELFDASAQFFKRDVWDDLDNLEIIRVRYYAQPDAEPGKEYFVSIMGMGGQEFGLAIYESIEDLNATLNVEDPDDPMAALTTTRAMNFSFGPKEGVLDADLAAIKKHKWAKPERNTYLAPLRYSMETGITSPTADEIAMAAAVFRVLPNFAYEEMKADEDDLVPATKTYALPAVHGGASVELNFPVEGVEIPDESSMMDILNLDDNPNLLNQLTSMFGGGLGNDQPKLPPENNGTWKKRK